MVYTSDMSSGAYDEMEQIVNNEDASQERVWSTNEIRKNSSNWSLAGDIGLLKHLQHFSHQLISRTHEMEKTVNSLVHHSKEASAKVNNVINDFQMLSNLQFIENRVYDEEEMQDIDPGKKAETQVKSKEQRETEMVARVTEALKIGISVLDKAFDRMDIDESSDSEDDDEFRSEGLLLEPKDLYENRPLPFIIGSKEFQDDEYAGLNNYPEEDLSQEITTPDEKFSASEESEDESSDEEIKKYPASTTFRNAVPQEDVVDRLSASDGSSDLFEEKNGENSSDSDFAIVDKPLVVQPEVKKDKISLMDELASKTKQRVAGNTVDKVAPSIKETVKETEPEKTKDEDLFTDRDGLFEDEDDSPFHKKTGLFSGDNLLSAQDEESVEDDLFASLDTAPVKKEKPIVTKVTPPVKEREKSTAPRKTSIILQDEDEDDDLFGSFSSRTSSVTLPSKQSSKVEKSKTNTASVPSITEKPKPSLMDDKSASNSLFGDDSDDDLFSKPIKSQSNLDFNYDDEGDLFSSLSSTEKKQHSVVQGKKEEKVLKSKTEKKSFPIAKKKPEEIQTKTTEKTGSLFEDSDNFDLFKPSVPKEEKPSTDIKKNSKDSAKPSERKPTLSLLEESDDFDLFSPTVKTVPPSKKVQTSKEEQEVSKSLFEDKLSAALEKKISPKEEQKVSKSLVEDKLSSALEKKISPVAENAIPVTQEEISNSFDSPVESTNILNPINKDRVKIQTKRRKPTRKGRQALISAESVEEKSLEPETASKSQLPEQDNTSDLFSSLKEDSNIPTKHQSSVDSPVTVPITHKKNEQDKRSLMSQLMSEAAGSKIGKRSSILQTENDEDDDDDLFASIKKPDKKLVSEDLPFLPSVAKSSEIMIKPNVRQSGDKAQKPASESPSDDELFSAPSFREFRSSISEKTSLFGGDDEDSDDIFKSSANKDVISQSSSSIVDESDDIFAGVDKEKYEMFPTQLLDDDDDDDIFSNLDKPSKPSNPLTTNVKLEKKQSTDIFQDPLGGLNQDD